MHTAGVAVNSCKIKRMEKHNLLKYSNNCTWN